MKTERSPAQLRWESSDEFRAIGSASAKANLRRFAEAPRCGALARSTGKPCQKPGLGAGGRCRWHGGATPSGSEWHKVQWAKGPLDRFYRKLDGLQRAAEKRRKRIAAMTPEQRQRYDAWLASHEPSSPGRRAARRDERKRNREIRAEIERLASAPEPAMSEELQRITAAIEILKAEICRREDEAGLFDQALSHAQPKEENEK